MNRVVALFGCTADPFTIAHRDICKKMMDLPHISKVVVIPTIVDYHREGKTKWLTDKERVKCINKMLWTLGSEYKDKWQVDTTELDLKETCEWIDTMSPCQENHIDIGLYEDIIPKRRFVHTLLDYCSRHPNDVVSIVLGSDSLKNLVTWYKWQAICKLANYIYVVQGRNGQEVEIPKRVEEIISSGGIRTIKLSKDEYNFVSASKVRECYLSRKYINIDDLLDVYINHVYKLDKNQVSIYDLGWI